MSSRNWKPLLKGGGIVLAALGALVVWESPRVDALDREVQSLVDLCASPGGMNRKAMAVGKLCELDNDDSHRALKQLAWSRNDQIATLALAALGREDLDGAESTLRDVLSDSKRSDGARAAALMAFCCKKAGEGADWSDISGYLNAQAAGNPALEGAAEAVAGRLWKEEK